MQPLQAQQDDDLDMRIARIQYRGQSSAVSSLADFANRETSKCLAGRSVNAGAIRQRLNEPAKLLRQVERDQETVRALAEIYSRLWELSVRRC